MKKKTDGKTEPKPEKKAPAVKQADKPTLGRAAFIHQLKAQGVERPDALTKVQEKFQCAKGLFERIWARGDRAAKAQAAS